MCTWVWLIDQRSEPKPVCRVWCVDGGSFWAEHCGAGDDKLGHRCRRATGRGAYGIYLRPAGFEASGRGRVGLVGDGLRLVALGRAQPVMGAGRIVHHLSQF